MSDLESVWRYSTGVLNAEQEIRVEALSAAAKVVDSVGSRVLGLAARFADWLGGGDEPV